MTEEKAVSRELKCHFISYNMDYYLGKAKELYEIEQEERREAQKRLAEFNKDDEIAELREQLTRTRKYSLMNMSDKEYEAAKAFREKHWQMHNGGQSKGVANTYQYELTGTVIGTCIKIRCPICGEEKDITDIDSW